MKNNSNNNRFLGISSISSSWKVPNTRVRYENGRKYHYVRHIASAILNFQVTIRNRKKQFLSSFSLSINKKSSGVLDLSLRIYIFSQSRFTFTTSSQTNS